MDGRTRLVCLAESKRGIDRMADQARFVEKTGEQGGPVGSRTGRAQPLSSLFSRQSPFFWPGLARELPLLLGILAGLSFLHAKGLTFVALHSPAGFDWSEYLQAAWMMAHRLDVGYPAFRNPLYPWLVGLLGEWMGSYPNAALWLASVGTCLIVLAAGLGARAFATSWAGGLAALSVPFVFDTALASRWTNLYPLLGGTTGMAIALGACAARWPRAVVALAAGVFSGLAWGLDNRSISVVLVVALLVLVGATQYPRRGRNSALSRLQRLVPRRLQPLLPSRLQRFVLPALFVMGALLGPLSKQTLALVPQKPLAEQVRLQRENDLRGILGAGVDSLRETCRDEPKYETPSLEAFERPCAQALWSYNLEKLERRLPFGLTLTLWLTPLVWLPARRGWRAVLSGLLVTSAGLAPFAVLSFWVMVPDRYVLHFAAPLAMLVPVALSKAVETLTPRVVAPYLLCAATLFAAWAVIFQVDHGPIPTPLHMDGRYRAMAGMLKYLRTNVGPNDVLLDCSAQGLETALLPRVYHDPPPNLTGTDTVRCMKWLEAPQKTEGARWVVAGVRCPFPPPPPGSPEASDLELCSACFAVPGPSMDVPCPHGKKVGRCALCRNATVPRDTWELVQWYYSGYNCLDTLMLFKWKGGS